MSIIGFLITRLKLSGDFVEELYGTFVASGDSMKAEILMRGIDRSLMELRSATEKKNVEKIIKLSSEILDSEKSMKSYLKGVKGKIRDERSKKYLGSVEEKVRDWDVTLNVLVEQIKKDNFPGIIRATNKARKNIKEYIKMSDLLRMQAGYIADESHKVMRESIKSTFITSGIGALILVFFTVLISLFIYRNISRSLSFFREVFSQGTSGDLLARYPVDNKARDEINHLGKLFNGFMDQVSGVIRETINTSNELGVSSEELSATTESFSDNTQSQAASSEEITATMEEISAGIENVSDNTQYQYDKLNELILEMNSLSEIIHEMDAKIADTQGMSGNISVLAQSGGKSLQLMNRSMSTIYDSSNKVRDIIGIINDISDRINLLSLNAAIEAARAGEAGRGFAVVADEISKLADQTASSISDIDSLIRVNKDEIDMGMKNVNDTIESISSIINGVESIGEMMNRIFQGMEQQKATNESVNRSAGELKVRSEEVRTATSEQKNAVNEVMKSITNINEMNQSIASGSEQITASTSRLATMAENLKNLVNFFKFR